jgi:hypothetical protein
VGNRTKQEEDAIDKVPAARNLTDKAREAVF